MEGDELPLMFKTYFLLLLLMSLVCFSLMGLDKRRARLGLWRVPEKTLFLFAVALGALGGTAGMFLFRHKTRHWYFRLFFPLLAALQLALPFLLPLLVK